MSALFPIYEKCLELRVPVSIMSGPYAGPDIEVSNPLYIDRLATRYPELKIILGHGCYPFIQEILGVAFKHPNVYVSPDMYIFALGGGAYVEAANSTLREQRLAPAYREGRGRRGRWADKMLCPNFNGRTGL